MTTYQWSPLWDKIIQKKLRSSLRKAQVDAVIEIGDLARLDVPYYLYQDLNFEVLERFYDPIEKKVSTSPGSIWTLSSAAEIVSRRFTNRQLACSP